MKGEVIMVVMEGKSVYGGIAVGKLHFYQREKRTVTSYQVSQPELELERFEKARHKAISQLGELYEKALAEVGEANALIFQVHQMMLEDTEYLNSVQNIIRSQGLNAEYAVEQTGEYYAGIFASMEDEYMKERAADMKDISDRTIRVLEDKEDKLVITEPVIIAAEDLAPSETVQFDKSKILSFLTRKGSVNSHTAILARTMNIPAIIGLGDELKEELNGSLVIVDGFTGKVYIDPEESIKQELLEKKRKDEERKDLLQELRGMENITKSGQSIHIYANIGSLEDIEEVIKNDAGGIGLLRSEFIYLNSTTFPTEEEQFVIYKKVATGMSGKKVIIRTLDIGADKQASYFNLPLEENPALGYRAIRICLTQREIFKTQLRAIYRASAYGNIAIMFPMIISVEEVQEIKEIIEEVKIELDQLGMAYQAKLELGIMIETPAAVMISDLLAKEVDFFSIGTNDLTQYTTAVDRQNPRLERFYHPHHIAILRMLQMTVDNAHNHGIWVGICGELAADLSLTEEFIRMGIDELSVSPGMVLELRKRIREIE
jgi:phosphotransferase system enzyme I (PtsI)